MKTWLAGIAAALAAGACATRRPDPMRREHLARQIADDAAAFNDAYGQAVSAQILLEHPALRAIGCRAIISP